MRTVGTVHDVNVAIIPRIGDGAGWVITAETVSYEFVSANTITLQIVQRPKEVKDEPVDDPPQPAAPSAHSRSVPVKEEQTASNEVPSHTEVTPYVNSEVEPSTSTAVSCIDGVEEEYAGNSNARTELATVPEEHTDTVPEAPIAAPSKRVRRGGANGSWDGRKRRRVAPQNYKVVPGANSTSTGSSLVVSSSALAVVPRRRITNYNRPVCDRGDCTSFAVGRVRSERLCKRHGGGPRCTVPQCPNASIGRAEVDDEFGAAGDRCRRHKGARNCCVPGCDTASFAVVQTADQWGEPGPRCKRHGGGGRCNVKGCTNCAAGRVHRDDEYGPAGGRCKAHGAGALCRYPGGCTKLATGGKVVIDEATGTLEYRCSHHGGGRRCEVADCVNLATGRVRAADEFGGPGEKRCRRHGGGLKCSVLDCPTLAIRKITEADKYGPAGRRCAKHSRPHAHDGNHSAWPLENGASHALEDRVPVIQNRLPLVPTRGEHVSAAAHSAPQLSVEERLNIEVERERREQMCR